MLAGIFEIVKTNSVFNSYFFCKSRNVTDVFILSDVIKKTRSKKKHKKSFGK